jgi:hypothetical protein
MKQPLEFHDDGLEMDKAKAETERSKTAIPSIPSKHPS